MQIHNNKGELVGEINTLVRPGQGVIITSTTYSGHRVTAQTISTRDNAGTVKPKRSTAERYCHDLHAGHPHRSGQVAGVRAASSRPSRVRPEGRVHPSRFLGFDSGRPN